MPLSETSWVLEGLLQGRPYRLTPEPYAGLIERFLEPSRNHTPEWRGFLRGRYGPAQSAWLGELCWNHQGSCGLEARDDPYRVEAFELGPLEASWLFAAGPAVGLPQARDALPLPESDAVPAPEPLAVAAPRPCPAWKAPRPIVVLTHAGEREVLQLTDCEGGIRMEALERLSLLARPPGTARPVFPLPLEPDGQDGEWVRDVRLIHPRLAWAIAELARAFPGHALLLSSGYRRDGHSGLHRTGRALDLAVVGVANEQLFGVCRRLRDVGCGFYPNNRFIHLDVRPYATGRVAWVDVSRPGEPSEYVDGWPGVLSVGSAWLGVSARAGR